jgi:hypothetical protein
MSDELARERIALKRADQDIAEGRIRVRRQEEVVKDLLARAQQAELASHLLDLLRETLTHWETHRTLIVQRIAYLEANA